MHFFYALYFIYALHSSMHYLYALHSFTPFLYTPSTHIHPHPHIHPHTLPLSYTHILYKNVAAFVMHCFYVSSLSTTATKA